MTAASAEGRFGRQGGQELVEFAAVLPLLILILFGVLDLGRVFHAAVVVANAAREGARYGTFYPDQAGDIIGVVQAEAQGSGIDLSDPSTSGIAVNCLAGCDSGTPIQVTVTYRVALILGLVLPTPQVDIVRSVEMLIP